MAYQFRRVAPLLALPLVSACSMWFSTGGLDYDKVQSQIKENLTSQYGSMGHTPSDVLCPRPKPPPKEGESFVCTATVDGHDDQEVRIQVTVGQDGNVNFRTLDTLYDLPIASEKLSEQLTANQGFDVSVDCGEGITMVADGDSFDCTATDPAGHDRTLRVTAGGVDNDDRWELLPEATP